MNYIQPIKNAVSYLCDCIRNIRNIASSPLEELAYAGVPNNCGLLSGPIGYGGIAYFSNNKVFDRNAGVYAGTRKRPHGLQGNNHGIKWENVSDLGEKAKLILEAMSLKKSDSRYKHTRHPSKSDINWARDHLGNHK